MTYQDDKKTQQQPFNKDQNKSKEQQRSGSYDKSHGTTQGGMPGQKQKDLNK